MAGELDFIRTNPHPNSGTCKKPHTNIECLLIIVESIYQIYLVIVGAFYINALKLVIVLAIRKINSFRRRKK